VITPAREDGGCVARRHGAAACAGGFVGRGDGDAHAEVRRHGRGGDGGGVCERAALGDAAGPGLGGCIDAEPVPEDGCRGRPCDSAGEPWVMGCGMRVVSDLVCERDGVEALVHP